MPVINPTKIKKVTEYEKSRGIWKDKKYLQVHKTLLTENLLFYRCQHYWTDWVLSPSAPHFPADPLLSKPEYPDSLSDRPIRSALASTAYAQTRLWRTAFRTFLSDKVLSKLSIVLAANAESADVGGSRWRRPEWREPERPARISRPWGKVLERGCTLEGSSASERFLWTVDGRTCRQQSPEKNHLIVQLQYLVNISPECPVRKIYLRSSLLNG